MSRLLSSPRPPRSARLCFRVTLEAIEAEVPAHVRLKAALKSLLRRFGLRCTAVEEVR